MSSTLRLTITLDDRLASLLGSVVHHNFLHDQEERFAVWAVDGIENPDGDDLRPLLGTDFADGSMTWASLPEALILRAFEQAAGFRTALLHDEELAMAPLEGRSGSYPDHFVVLSSRPFPHGPCSAYGC